MKIGLRYGHSINCRGASGKVDEVNECRWLYFRVKELLEALGHTVINCCSDASSEGAELAEGTNKANANGVDLYVTLHMNAYNGQANGVECLVYDTASNLAINVGKKVCSNISDFGICNRGIKYGGNNFHDLSKSDMNAIIVESIFCDNANDANIFNAKKEQFARAIANGIDSRVSLEIENKNTIVEEKKKVKNIVVYSNDVDKRAAEYLADYLSCPTISSRQNFDYTTVETVYAVGGSIGTYTAYLLEENFISGSDRYETLKAMLRFIDKL